MTTKLQTPHYERSRLWRAVSVVAFVTVAAPPIGSLAYVALAMVRSRGGEFSGAAAAPIGELASGLVSIGYLVVIFSYMLGGAAAAFAGVALGYHVYNGDGDVSLKRALITALIATLTGAIALELVLRGDAPPPAFVLMLLPPALVAAVICRWLMLKLGLIGARTA